MVQRRTVQWQAVWWQAVRWQTPWLRRGMVWSLVLGGVVLGAGCTSLDSAAPSSPTDTSGNGGTSPSEITMVDARGQLLPVTAMTTLGEQDIFLEVAATPQQQALGLMFREALPDDRGMLFPLGRPRPVSFWMKNVPVPLDMVFVYQGKVAAIAADVPPCTADPCPTYGPEGQLVDQVIELRAGRAAELGVAVGDAVVINPR